MHHLILALLATLWLSNPVFAQETDGEAESTEDHGGEGGANAEIRSTATRILDPAGVPARIAEIQALCSSADAYKIDCLAERFEALEKDMALLHGQAPVRDVLGQTARSLRKIARENRDRQRPRIKLSAEDGSQSSHRPLIAVAPERQAAAQAAALAVLEEAETILLRSAENSASRSVQYQQIAAAIGSSKVLLRSA